MTERTTTRNWGDWGLRLLALGIAIGIWFNASVEDRLVSSEKVVEANVIYNRPSGFMVIDPVLRVNVRLLGNERAIRQLSPYQVEVQVELTPKQEGTGTITLSPGDVLAPEGLEVVSIEPSEIPVNLEPEVSQSVPVIPKIEGSPANGAEIGKLDVLPSHAFVTGPKSVITRLASLATDPISLDGRSASFEVQVPVVLPSNLIQ
ncbi:MAG TPA: CdaR family protein, partial [Thermoanaerobaculia bacterium]|nr:CdaR family protein [Thermoanaerobaculia bacterium]